MCSLSFQAGKAAIYADGLTGMDCEGLMADVRQINFSQTSHFHDDIAVNIIFQHGSCNFQGGFTFIFRIAFLNCTLLPQLDFLLDILLLKLLCGVNEYISILWHTLYQFASKGFGMPILYSVSVISPVREMMVNRVSVNSFLCHDGAMLYCLVYD